MHRLSWSQIAIYCNTEYDNFCLICVIGARDTSLLVTFILWQWRFKFWLKPWVPLHEAYILTTELNVVLDRVCISLLFNFTNRLFSSHLFKFRVAPKIRYEQIPISIKACQNSITYPITLSNINMDVGRHRQPMYNIQKRKKILLIFLEQTWNLYYNRF